MARIIETDNFGSDYPDEKFLNIPSVMTHNAHDIADAINRAFPHDYPRHWRAVQDDYVLQGGFEP